MTTTTVQGLGRSVGSWPQMHVTADSYNSSGVLQATVTITPNTNGSWSHAFTADSSGSYRIITETDGYSRHVWRISVPATGGPYKVTEILVGASRIPEGSVTSTDILDGTITPADLDLAQLDARYNGTAAALALVFGA